MFWIIISVFWLLILNISLNCLKVFRLQEDDTEIQNKYKCSYTSFTFKYPAATANQYYYDQFSIYKIITKTQHMIYIEFATGTCER